MVVNSNDLREPHNRASAIKQGNTSIHQVVRSCGAQPDQSKPMSQRTINAISVAGAIFGDASIFIGVLSWFRSIVRRGLHATLFAGW